MSKAGKRETKGDRGLYVKVILSALSRKTEAAKERIEAYS